MYLDEWGKDIPKASMAVAIVLAVYIPPQAPGPGHELRTISLRSSSLMREYIFSPYDWKADTMSSYTMIYLCIYYKCIYMNIDF